VESLDAVYAEFFREYPDAFAGVQVAPIREGGPPEVLFSTQTMKRFLTWADAKGYVTKNRDQIPELHHILTQLEFGEHQ
jgi:hypothetical protein